MLTLGWAWYPPLELCEESHLSIEFMTRKPDGTLLYNGPIGPPEEEENLISDFVNLELVMAHPRLLVDFGSGTLELRIQTKYGLGKVYIKFRNNNFWSQTRF